MAHFFGMVDPLLLKPMDCGSQHDPSMAHRSAAEKIQHFWRQYQRWDVSLQRDRRKKVVNLSDELRMEESKPEEVGGYGTFSLTNATAASDWDIYNSLQNS